MFEVPPLNSSYWVGSGGWLRIDGYGPIRNGNTTYYAHGTGKDTGLVYRYTINQGTCH